MYCYFKLKLRDLTDLKLFCLSVLFEKLILQYIETEYGVRKTITALFVTCAKIFNFKGLQLAIEKEYSSHATAMKFIR